MNMDLKNKKNIVFYQSFSVFMCQDTTYDESENATLGDSANAIRAKEGV